MATNKYISQLTGSVSPALSGYTIYDDGIKTYKLSLTNLRNTIVPGLTTYATTGSNIFNGNQLIKGDLVISGSLTAQQYIVSSSVTHITNQSLNGSSVFGNSMDDTHLFTGSISLTGSLNVKGPAIVSGSLVVGLGGLENDNPEALHAENSGSYNIVHFQGNQQDYAQLNVKNINSGSVASTDIVATANNGTENIHYVDMGINSSTYNAGFVGYANDAYLINAGKDLYVGTLGGYSHPNTKVHIFAQNHWQNPQITISGSHQIMFNTSSVSEGYVYEFSGSIKLDDNLKVDGHIETGKIQGTGSLTLQPDLEDGRTIEIYNTSPSDIHIKGNATYTFLGDDTTYVKLDASDETVTINTNNGVQIYGNVDTNGYHIDANGGNVEGVNFNVNGILNIGAISERVTPYDDTNIFNHSYTESAILYVTNISNDFTINITDISESNNHALGFTTIVEQGSTPYTVDSFKIYNVAQSITWVGGLSPITVANSVNVFSFSMLRINGDWKVFGQLTTF